MSKCTKINKEGKKINYKGGGRMNQIDDTHVMKERKASRRWGRGSYGGLAQHSGSAGNSNHNHFSAPHAYFYMPVDPRHHHSRSASGPSLKTVPMCAGL